MEAAANGWMGGGVLAIGHVIYFIAIIKNGAEYARK
jgi:hypothetical protein